MDTCKITMTKSEDRKFRKLCREYMKLPVEERIRRGFRRAYRPVLDDAPSRSFNTMKEYREWCDKNLPEYLGFKIVNPSGPEFGESKGV